MKRQQPAGPPTNHTRRAAVAGDLGHTADVHPLPRAWLRRIAEGPRSPAAAVSACPESDDGIAPHLGRHKLAELTPEMIARRQAERIAAGAGRVAVLHALALLGGILQRAVEGERIARSRPGL